MNKANNFSSATGTIYYQGSKEELASIFNENGLKTSIGEWAIRFPEFEPYFEISYVGNISEKEPFEIEASGCDVQTMKIICESVAKSLKNGNIKYEIEVWDANQELVNELHNR